MITPRTTFSRFVGSNGAHSKAPTGIAGYESNTGPTTMGGSLPAALPPSIGQSLSLMESEPFRAMSVTGTPAVTPMLGWMMLSDN
eukprot:4518946-Amphidinium_carterae.1